MSRGKEEKIFRGSPFENQEAEALANQKIRGIVTLMKLWDLKYNKDMTHRDIAAELGINESNILSRLEEAENLQKIFELEFGESYSKKLFPVLAEAEKVNIEQLEEDMLSLASEMVDDMKAKMEEMKMCGDITPAKIGQFVAAIEKIQRVSRIKRDLPTEIIGNRTVNVAFIDLDAKQSYSQFKELQRLERQENAKHNPDLYLKTQNSIYEQKIEKVNKYKKHQSEHQQKIQRISDILGSPITIEDVDDSQVLELTLQKLTDYGVFDAELPEREFRDLVEKVSRDSITELLEEQESEWQEVIEVTEENSLIQ